VDSLSFPSVGGLAEQATKSPSSGTGYKVPFCGPICPTSGAIRSRRSYGEFVVQTIEVFADVACPFTHVGLRRFFEYRAEENRTDVKLWVRSWPLEIVNGAPLDPHFVADEVDDIRDQVAPLLFAGFDEAAFPSTSMPALALAAAAYRRSRPTGEQVSAALRDRLFERGINIADPAVLDGLAVEFDLGPVDADPAPVLADYADGVRRGVVGSPHFFTPTGGYFCPALDVSRDAGGHLRVAANPAAFDDFVASCFA
jgi:2-hydroxychromene-2-carboxylate isomerase